MTTAQRLSADRMIAAYGQAVTLTRRAAGAYNTATGTAAITTSTQTGKGVILPFGQGIRKQGGTAVTAADRLCYLSGLNSAGAALTEPKVDDTLTDANSAVYTITEVSPLEPAGLAIMYELTIRSAT
ncbi:MAG: hypothetical protein RL268_283 [Pseudomonadota bacterium]|jgi:hypothetical protein